MKSLPSLCWIDIETTGLDPALDPILEVGIVLTNPSLEIEQSASYTVKVDSQYLQGRLAQNPKVEEMHTRNGLLQEVAGAARGREGTDRLVADWILQHKGASRPLAGSNPDFDRRFLTRQMPTVARLLHYRSLDMNALYYVMGIEKNGPATTHRGLDDIMRDLDALRRIRQRLEEVWK